MKAVNQDQLREGALNLLQDCMSVRSGDKLVIVYEPEAMGWYDKVSHFVADVATALGVHVTTRQAAAPGNDVFDEDDIAGIGWDSCIYFARVGDQIRFDKLADGRTRVMSYASTIDALASPYGRTPHTAMLDMKRAIDQAIATADSIGITCPFGTDVVGTVGNHGVDADVSIKRFPMGVHAPVVASQFSGRVVLSRYVTTTASRVYDPPWIGLDEVVVATVAEGRITGFAGNSDDVARVEVHYDHVSQVFDLDRDNVHSWHAGIHPGRSFHESSRVDPDRWSNTVFTSPQFVHFHTCGSEPPGEISWTIPDPTISLDDVALWDDGVLKPERVPSTAAVLEQWPELRGVFDGTKPEVGLHA